MAGTNKQLLIQVRADLMQAQSALRSLSHNLDALGASGKRAASNTHALGGAWDHLVAAATTYLTISSAIRALRMADNFNVLQQRIKTATKATGDYTQVSGELFDMAQRSGVQLSNTVDVFQRLARAANELGANNQQILQVTEAVQQLGVISGASNAAMEAGLMQFGQMMSSGVARAEEMNSLLENIPEVANRIAKGMGMTVGQLRQAVINGKVLSKDVFDSLLKQVLAIRQDFGDMGDSLGRASVRLENSFAKFLDRAEKSLHVVSSMAFFFDQMSRSMDKSDSFMGFLASMGALGPEAMMRQERISAYESKEKAYQEKISGMRDELAKLTEQINQKSDQLLGMDPMQMGESADVIAKELWNLREQRDQLNKKIAETAKLHYSAGQAAASEANTTKMSQAEIAMGLESTKSALLAAIDLHKQQVQKIKDAEDAEKALAKSFRDANRELSDTAKYGNGGSALDISSRLQGARQLINQKDMEGAVKAAEKARDMILDLNREGSESSYVLQYLMKQAEQIGIEAAQGVKEQRKSDLEDASDLILRILSEAERLKALKVGFDDTEAQQKANELISSLQKEFSANPLELPVILKAQSSSDIDKFYSNTPVRVPANATGGPIRGPGTGTSDSVLMWGSNGEYVVRAAAVQHYGSDFLARINNMHLPRFADGGLVGLPPVTMPNFTPPAAAGGTPIHLHLNGKSYQVTAPQNVAEKMRRELEIEAMMRGGSR